MKVLIVMDSFKGCLSSREAGDAIARGILKVSSNAEVFVCPIADGGEGTIEAVSEISGAKRMTCRVEDPYGEQVCANYIILPGEIAVLEMAQAAGLNLSNLRAPLMASTYGVGMMIHDAIRHGCRHFILGIGGSATNDGGAGMLEALGFHLLDEDRNRIERGALGLKSLAFIEDTAVLPELKNCTFKVACDVTAPLLGKQGCSHVFGPQKGADIQTICDMDRWLAHYANIVKKYYPDSSPDEPGSGAAGGLGFALKVFCYAKLLPGLPIISEFIHLEEKIQDSDIVIVGEGRMDAQTMMGKAPDRIAEIANKYHKPVIAIVGEVEDCIFFNNNMKIDAIFSIQQRPCSLDEAMNPETTKRNLEYTAAQVFRVISL